MEEAGGADRALIFGATGFIGSNLARRLAARGVSVTVFRRPGSSLDNLADCPREEVVGDIHDPKAVTRALEGRSSVYNLAACTSLLDRDAEERERVNEAFVRTLAEAMLGRRGLRLVHCSTVGTAGLSEHPTIRDEGSVFNASHIHYFATKKRAEETLARYIGRGLDAVIVNPGLVIGSAGMRPVQKRAFLQAATGRQRFYPSGGACISYVDDVVHGMIRARELGHVGERYILGGTNVTFLEYFRRIAFLGGARPPGIRLPRFLLPAAGWAMELLLGSMGRDSGLMAAGFGYYASDKALRELGYKITPLDDALADIYRDLVRPGPSEGGRP